MIKGFFLQTEILSLLELNVNPIHIAQQTYIVTLYILLHLRNMLDSTHVISAGLSVK